MTALFPLAILLVIIGAAHARADEKKAWIFFDLGQTLVDTDSFSYNPMFYLPGAKEYLDQVVAAGHPVGLIIDIPEDWGKGYPAKDELTSKWLRTIDFIAGKVPDDGASWRGDPFDITPFGSFQGQGKDRVFKGRVLLPFTNAQRKDEGSTYLFEEARRMAEAEGAKVLYVSEAADHVQAARGVGLAGHTILPGVTGPMYVPLPEIDRFVEFDIRQGCTTILHPAPAPAPSAARKKRRVGL